MKKKNLIFAVALSLTALLPSLWNGTGIGNLSAQCIPTIKIDGNNIIADEANSYGIKLPSWLKAGQTLAVSQNVFSIAVIEFTVNGSALDYYQNLSITTVQTVPSNKVWKIESIHKDPNPIVIAPWTTPGTYTFTPTCNGIFRVQVWGAGGGGGFGDQGSYCGGYVGGGGGGGGYTEGSYSLVGGTNYVIVVGTGGVGGVRTTCGAGTYAGGTGGASSVSVISISASGGAGGNDDGPSSTSTGGAFGSGSGGQINLQGITGGNGAWGGNSGKGGDGGGGGGTGGAVKSWTAGAGNAGNAPGGGGSGGNYTGDGGVGAAGKVLITMTGVASALGSTSRDKLQMSGVINATITTTCGYVVPTGYIFRIDDVIGANLQVGTTCGATDKGTLPTAGPYPQWFVAGTYFSTSAGTAYLRGAEFNIN